MDCVFPEIKKSTLPFMLHQEKYLDLYLIHPRDHHSHSQTRASRVAPLLRPFLPFKRDTEHYPYPTIPDRTQAIKDDGMEKGMLKRFYLFVEDSPFPFPLLVVHRVRAT